MPYKDAEKRKQSGRVRSRRYYQATKETRPKRRHDYWYTLKRLYGMTREDYDRLLKAQLGCCAVCDEPFKKVPAVDHNHETLQIRGLLCQGCNIAVGVCEKGRIPAAMAYLLHHSRPKLKVVV